MFQVLFKFGECFSHFSGEDEWRQTVKRYCIKMYTLDSRFYVLLLMSKLNVEDRRLHKDATTLCTLKVELEDWFGFAWGSHPYGGNLFALGL